MKHDRSTQFICLLLASALAISSAAHAHKLREKGLKVAVAESSLTVTPTRDWNRLDGKVGNTWEQLLAAE